MKEPIRNFIEKEKDLIDAQDYLSEAGMDFLIGGAGGLVSSTPRLFDISLDAYRKGKYINGLDKKLNDKKTK